MKAYVFQVLKVIAFATIFLALLLSGAVGAARLFGAETFHANFERTVKPQVSMPFSLWERMTPAQRACLRYQILVNPKLTKLPEVCFLPCGANR